MKRGPKPMTPAERAMRKAEAKANIRNISVDADLVAALNVAADALELKFGFRPTISQTLRHLIKAANA